MLTKNNFHLSTFNFQLIKVAVVDDHQVVADGFERLINDTDFARVIAKAHSAAGCRELLATVDADVLLLDVSLPDGNGIELCPQIKTDYPNLKILFLTSHNEMTNIRRGLDSGASGYMLKNAPAEEIIEGIRTVASGKQFLSEEVSAMLKNRDHNEVRLSRREQELLRLIAAGKSTAEIADSMCLGYETIKTYRKHLMLKLQVSNMAQLVKMAVDKNLI
jgi:DNA-binding NarL/FixJ family response regulator